MLTKIPGGQDFLWLQNGVPVIKKYLLNGKTLESWDPIKDGEWTRTSPEQLNELSAFAALSTNGLKDSFIKNENGYDHYGITRDRV